MPATFQSDPAQELKKLLKKWKNKPTTADRPERVDAFSALHKDAEDAKLFMERFLSNNLQIQKSFNFFHTHGPTHPFREEKFTQNAGPTNFQIRKRMKKVLDENAALVERVVNIKGNLKKTSAKVLSPREKKLRDFRKFVTPKDLLSKYTNLEFPSGELLWKLLRPRIWFDLEVKRANLAQFCHISIELYTEAAPLPVLEFVRCCACCHCDRLKVVHIFPGLWLEGQLKLRSSRITQGPLEYDLRALNHDAGAGILSFPMEFIDGCPDGVLCFTISTRPLKVLNGKRLAIGRVIDGLKEVERLQEYGTKTGKLKKEIVLVGCGVDS